MSNEKSIHKKLMEIDSVLISITKNTNEDYNEFEIGIPNSWVYDETSDVKCEIVHNLEMGKVIKISPKKKNVVEDDLFDFIKTIIDTNLLIEDKEKQFKDKFNKMRLDLEEDAKKFYNDLDELKKSSFKKIKKNNKTDEQNSEEILEIETTDEKKDDNSEEIKRENSVINKINK